VKIHDISVAIHERMVIWPGLIPTRLVPHERTAEGDPVNVTNIDCCAHAGSHVDAPFHHYPDGDTIEAMDLSRFMGPALVADLTSVQKAVGREDVSRAMDGQGAVDILLLKTRNSTDYPTWERFDPEYVYVAADGAEEIVRRGVRTLGVDHLAVEEYGAGGFPTHKLLLGKADVTVVEGLDLRGIEPGRYWFCAAPIKLVGSDGAPVRAFLVEDSKGELSKAWNVLRESRDEAGGVR
jgi:arylformamidase